MNVFIIESLVEAKIIEFDEPFMGIWLVGLVLCYPDLYDRIYATKKYLTWSRTENPLNPTLAVKLTRSMLQKVVSRSLPGPNVPNRAVGIFRRLYDLGVNFTGPEFDNFDWIRITSMTDRLEALRAYATLLELGVSPNQSKSEKKGFTLLHTLAASYVFEQPPEVNGFGMTESPAVDEVILKVINLCRDKGVSFMNQDEGGNTPFHISKFWEKHMEKPGWFTAEEISLYHQVIPQVSHS
jgi:hypothetical protein